MVFPDDEASPHWAVLGIFKRGCVQLDNALAIWNNYDLFGGSCRWEYDIGCNEDIAFQSHAKKSSGSGSFWLAHGLLHHVMA